MGTAGSAASRSGGGPSPPGGGGSNIRVVVRVRPLVSGELARGESSALRVHEDGRSLDAVTARAGDKETLRRFGYDRVCGPEATQADFFAASGVANLMDAALEGINVSVFAYGQTGSGKTFSEYFESARWRNINHGQARWYLPAPNPCTSTHSPTYARRYERQRGTHDCAPFCIQ
jgi:hypothetical protein